VEPTEESDLEEEEPEEEETIRQSTSFTSPCKDRSKSSRICWS